MGPLERAIENEGVDIGGGWRAYGYILYRGRAWGENRISLATDIQPGDGEDSIADWIQYLEDERGHDAADAFDTFVARIFRDPWPENRNAVRDRLMEAGVTHSTWPRR